MIIYTYSCWNCEGTITEVALFNVETGTRTNLGAGSSAGRAQVPPAGDRILVTGESLRIYSHTGQLLRQITPPPGTAIASAAWSPDGSRFVYVLGPKGFQLGI